MKDEFNRNKESDYNKKIKEFKRFEAVEYYKVREIKQMPPEVKKFKEGFNDKPVEEKKEIKNQLKEKLDSKQENNRNDENINSSSNNTSNNVQGEEVEASASTTSTASTSAASSSTASSVVSSATLTSGVSIISAVAVVAAVGAAIIKKAPDVKLLKVEAGTDYVYYELDIQNLAEKEDEKDKDIYYKIRVYNGMFEEEQVFYEAGIQKKIVSGLTPNRQYKISVIAGDDEYGFIEYFSYDFSTNKEEMPRAVFDITPKVDESIYGDLFKVEYNVFISDNAQVGYQTYLEIYYDDKLVKTRSDLSEDNFFRGFLEDVNEGTNISMLAYTYYYDELTQIGEFGYLVTYPETMKEAIYQSSYDPKDPLITTSDLGYVLDIDTGFESKNDNEAYIIDVYKTGETTSELTKLAAYTEDDLIQSIKGNTKEITITVPGNVSGVEVYFTPIKETETSKRTYEKTLIGTYSFAEYRSKEMPKANITFTDNNLDNNYSLNYQIDITDTFIVGKDYYVEVYNNNKLIKTSQVNTKNYSSSISDLYNGDNVLVKLFATVNSTLKEIASKNINISKSLDNPVTDAELNLYDDGYYVGFNFEEDLELENVTATTTITYDDGAVNQFDSEVYGSYGDEGTFDYNDLSYKVSNVKSLVVQIKSNDKLIKELVYDSDDARIDFDDYEIDSSANVTIPYNVVLSNDQVFNSLLVEYESGSSGYYELNEKSGNINILDLNSSSVKYDVYLYYENNGFRIQRPFSHSFDLSVEVDMDYFAAYINSQAYAYIKLNAKIDDIAIENNIDISFLEVNKDYSDNILNLSYVSATLTEKGYYEVSLDSASDLKYIRIKPNNSLYNLDNPYVVSYSSILNNFEWGTSYVDSKYAFQFGQHNLVDSDSELNYVHTIKNGINHYYFYTNLDISEAPYGAYNQIIYYTYKDENNNLHYDHVDIGLENAYELVTTRNIIDFNYSLVAEYANQYVNSDSERVSPESLSLYELKDNSYVLSSDTLFRKNKNYYILDNDNYVLANPSNLGLYIRSNPTFELTDDESFTGKYYCFDSKYENYKEATPSNQYLYIYNNGYQLATSDSFEQGVAYYKALDGGGYTSVKPKDLGLFEYTAEDLVLSSDTEFKFTKYEVATGEFIEASDKRAIVNDVFYYDQENEKTIISFTIDNDRTNSDSVSVTLGNNTYEIELKSSEEVLEDQSPSDIKTYEISLTSGSAMVSVYLDDTKITRYLVDIELNGNLVEYPIKQPVLNYNFYPKMVLEHFDTVVGIEDVIINKNFTICKNTMSYSNPAQVSISINEDDYYLSVGYSDLEGIDIEGNGFIVYVYSDSSCTDLISSQEEYYGKSVQFLIPNTYSVVYIKTEFVKESNGYKTVLNIDDIGLQKLDYIENISIDATSDGIEFSGTLHSSNLRYELVTEYESEDPYVDDGEFEEFEFSLMASHDENAKDYLLKIYDNNTGLLLNTYTYSNFITVSDYEYEDETDYITLPYQINLPEGYEIGSGSRVSYLDDTETISQTSGNLVITRLDSNYIILQFDLVITNSDGQTINYRIMVEKEFEITDYDIDYEIVGYNASDYSYTAVYAAYDSENDKYYTYHYDSESDTYIEFVGSGTYYDKDGNEAPANSTQVLINHRGVYAVKATMVFMVGPLKVDYSDYVINVTKSGADFITNSHTIPTVSASSYVIDGNEVSGEVLIPMLHYGLENYEEIAVNEYRTELFQKIGCEIELEITFGGNTYTKVITYSPPIYYAEVNDCFTSTATSQVSKNEDGTINLYVDTYFDDSNPNMRYKIFLYDASNLQDSSLLLEESDFLNTSEYTFTNIPNKAYVAYVKVYYLEDGIYLSDMNNATKSLGRINSAVTYGYISWDFNTSKYYLEYHIKENMVDNQNGSAILNIGDTDYEISLADGTYEAGSYSVDVSSSNGEITIKVTNASAGEDLVGTITLEETIDSGNTYDVKTYTVSFN